MQIKPNELEISRVFNLDFAYTEEIVKGIDCFYLGMGGSVVILFRESAKKKKEISFFFFFFFLSFPGKVEATERIANFSPPISVTPIRLYPRANWNLNK